MAIQHRYAGSRKARMTYDVDFRKEYPAGQREVLTPSPSTSALGRAKGHGWPSALVVEVAIAVCNTGAKKI